MRWFLRLFPEFRELENSHREASISASRFQDQVADLLDQNRHLTDEIRSAREAERNALKTVANIGLQLHFGTLPPYPEAFALPQKPQGVGVGPVPTHRFYGRDAVEKGREEFMAALESLRNPPPAPRDQ